MTWNLMNKEEFTTKAIIEMAEILSKEYQDSVYPILFSGDSPTLREYDEFLYFIDFIWQPFLEEFTIIGISEYYNDVPKSLFILNLKCTGYDNDLYYYDEKLNILVDNGDGTSEYDYTLRELEEYINKIESLR